jgi:hypothetical protein
MITGLFQEIKKILSRNVFEEKKQKRRGFKGPVEGDDVRVRVQRLVNGDLKRDKGPSSRRQYNRATYLVHLGRERLIIEVGLGETLYRVFASVRRGRAAGVLAVEIHVAHH